MVANVIVLGAGASNGVGGALARRFAKEGLHVIVSGRTLEKVTLITDEINADGGSAEACAVDVTLAIDQDRLFELAQKQGSLAAVLYNAGNNAVIPFAEVTPEQFEAFWRVGSFGAFLAAQRAMPIMIEQRSGSMIFTGASASLRGRPRFAHFAASKAALRSLAQALAREYGPQGVHVAHVVIDGVIKGDQVQKNYSGYIESLGEEGALEIDAIADAFWAIHAQNRTAWTHELDLRPFAETW